MKKNVAKLGMLTFAILIFSASNAWVTVCDINYQGKKVVQFGHSQDQPTLELIRQGIDQETNKADIQIPETQYFVQVLQFPDKPGATFSSMLLQISVYQLGSKNPLILMRSPYANGPSDFQVNELGISIRCNVNQYGLNPFY